MGLFSKLFSEGAGKAVGDLLNNLGTGNNQGNSQGNNSGQGVILNGQPIGGGNNYSGTVVPNNDGGYSNTGAMNQPSGNSWGPVMPAEENQFNYKGSYIQYFEEIFRNEFPAYQIEKEKSGKITVFTFYSGGVKALVVELLNSNSGRYKLREECRRTGVPYLRYYYDHKGWWNTKSYVIERTRKALAL